MTSDKPTPREQFIQHQRAWLAPQATGEWLAGGRRTPEEPDCFRTCFQRDRDRIIHCSAFRRLDYKTQVFVPHEQDHFRTRLTHTLEVAQIGRDLARALRVNEDLVEAAALGHDLGHPPFGHAGEAVLAELMADHGHFEHNSQSLRIVDYLEHPYPGFRGLNLTRALRQCLAKHTTRYDAPVVAEFGGAQAPIEGQLVDACDEIAYTSADLEDALQAEWISPEQLAGLELWEMAWRQVELHDADARDIHKRIRATKALLAILAGDLLEATQARITAMALDSAEAVQGASVRCVTFGEDVGRMLGTFQAFMLREVYTNQPSQAKGADARRCIVELFNGLIGKPESLPERYSRRIGADGLHRVVCDYIAGMTDRYCIAEHTRVCATVAAK